jgi:hypothetical protein
LRELPRRSSARSWWCTERTTALGSKKKDLRIFTAEEGGAEHCQVDHRQYGVDFIGDWLLKNL